MRKLGYFVLSVAVLFFCGTSVFADQETPLVVDASASSGRVPYLQTHWYTFKAAAYTGYRVCLKTAAGDANAYLLTTDFSLVGSSTVAGINDDNIYFALPKPRLMHLGVFGAVKSSSDYSIRVITSPAITGLDPVSGGVNTS